MQISNSKQKKEALDNEIRHCRRWATWHEYMSSWILPFFLARFRLLLSLSISVALYSTLARSFSRQFRATYSWIHMHASRAEHLIEIFSPWFTRFSTIDNDLNTFFVLFAHFKWALVSFLFAIWYRHFLRHSSALLFNFLALIIFIRQSVELFL